MADPEKPQTGDEDPLIRQWREKRGIADDTPEAEPKSADTDDDSLLEGLLESKEDEAAIAGLGLGSAVPQSDQIEDVQKRMLERRRRRSRRGAVLFAATVVAPVLLVWLYLVTMVTPLYETKAVLTISHPNQDNPGGASGILGALGGASDGMTQVFMADEFSRSPALFTQLQSEALRPRVEEAGLATLVADPDAQVTEIVDSSVNIQTGMMTLYLRAPEPEQAVAFGAIVLDLITEHVDRLGADLRDQRLDVSRQAVEEARESLLAAKRALVEFQVTYGEIDPSQRMMAVYQTIAETELEISGLRADLGRAEVGGTADSYDAQRLRALIDNLQNQIAAARQSLVEGDESGASLNEILMEYEMAAQQVAIAEQTLASALTALSQAQAEVALERAVTQVVVPPLPAKSPTFPHVLVTLFITMLIGLGVFFTARMVMVEAD